ncbi:MAG: nuclear transport factor 2 family protein [Proteobacteria bacterium]|nr:MAG: nuclear transport factor 2 family protein [Pseudomonadota bacterium]
MPSQTELEILNLSKAKFLFKTQGDFDRLEAVFDDELEFVHITGHVSTKGEWMEELRSKRFIYERIDLKEAHASVDGDTAELNGKAVFTVLVHGSRGTYNLAYTERYRRQNGIWTLVGLYTNTYNA